MKTLISLVKTQLKTLHDKVYFEQAPQDPIYPYIVFSYREPDFGNEPRRDIIFSIELFDKTEDPVWLEDKCDAIDEIFNRWHLINPEVLANFYRYSRYPNPSQDPTVRSREIAYIAQIYD